jgi:hypothetical protein
MAAEAAGDEVVMAAAVEVVTEAQEAVAAVMAEAAEDATK